MRLKARRLWIRENRRWSDEPTVQNHVGQWVDSPQGCYATASERVGGVQVERVSPRRGTRRGGSKGLQGLQFHFEVALTGRNERHDPKEISDLSR